MNKTAIIIGGGLGGLFTGAILAKEGLHVTVLEKNATAGGGLQTFRRFSEEFDTGMHVIGGMQPGGNIRRICQYLGIMDKVELMNVDDECTDSLYFAEDKMTYRIQRVRKGLLNPWQLTFLRKRHIWKNILRRFLLLRMLLICSIFDQLPTCSRCIQKTF